MLKKLMKYDLKSLFKNMIPLYLILILMSFSNRVMHFLSSKFSVLNIIGGFVTALYIILLVGIVIAAFIVGIARYYTNLVKEEGYLMHTLPVKKSSLILSKLFSSFIVFISSLVVVIGAFFIGCVGVYFSFDSLIQLFQIPNPYNTLFWIIIILTLIVGIIFQQVMIYLSISLGQRHNSNKAVYSIVYGIVTYNVAQIISFIFLTIPMIFNSKFLDTLSSENPSLGVLNGFMIMSVVVTIVITVVYYYFTKRIMENKLNLE